MIEKKLKKAAGDIKMSDELKDRIIRETRRSAPETEGAEQVFTVEHYKPRSILRIVSGIAACVVLVGAVGTAGFMLTRNAPGQLSDVDEESKAVSQAVIPDAGAPFGMLTKRNFYLSHREIANAQSYLDFEALSEMDEILSHVDWSSGTDQMPGITMERNATISLSFTDTPDQTHEELLIYGSFICHSFSDFDAQMGTCQYYDITGTDVCEALTKAIVRARNRFSGISDIEDADIQQLSEDCIIENLAQFNFSQFNSSKYSFYQGNISEDKQKQMLTLFNSIEWTEANINEDIAATSPFIGYASYRGDNSEGATLGIYESYLCYETYDRLSDGSTNTTFKAYYTIPDPAYFLSQYNSILYGEGVTGDYAPFGTDTCYDDWQIGGIMYDYSPRDMTQTEAQEVIQALRGYYFVTSDAETVNKMMESNENITLTHEGKTLTLPIGSSCAIYNDGEQEHYYVLPSDVAGRVHYIVYYHLRMFPAVGSIRKMASSLYCESDSFTGDLTQEQINNVSQAFYNKSWESSELTESLLCEQGDSPKLLYKFTGTTDVKGHQDVWYIYDDCTIEYASNYNDDHKILRYWDTDPYQHLLGALEYSVTH